MDYPFRPVKTFLNCVEFKSPSAPDIFFNRNKGADLEVSIDVMTREGSDASLHLVDLHVRLIPRICGKIVFDLKVIYSTLVEISDKNIDEESRDLLLKVVIPQDMYNPLRSLIWQMTSISGFPPVMLPDYDFSKPRNKPSKISNDEEVEAPEENNHPLGYKWIMEEMCLTKEGADFIETLKEETHCDLSRYEDLPAYKYFYRFLEPIAYNHPDIEDCEDSFWDILFHLLFGEGEEVAVTEGETGLPEIEFTQWEEKRTVSSLSLIELKMLASDLAVHSFTHTTVEMFRMKIDKEYAETLRNDRPVMKEELMRLYNCDQPDTDPSKLEFAEWVFSRIKECDLQTFPYKFMME